MKRIGGAACVLALALLLALAFGVREDWSRAVAEAARLITAAEGMYIDYDTLPGAELHRSMRTGLVRSLFALSGDLSLSGVKGSPEQIARLFLSEHNELFGLSKSTSELCLVAMGGGKDTGYALHFRQRHLGIPVEPNEVSLGISRLRAIIYVVNTCVPIDLPDVTPKVSADQAVKLAAESLLERANPKLPRDTRTRLLQEPYLAIIAEEGKPAQLIWAVRLAPRDPGGLWSVVINAKDGSLVSIRDLAVSGSGPLSTVPSKPNSADGARPEDRNKDPG